MKKALTKFASFALAFSMLVASFSSFSAQPASAKSIDNHASQTAAIKLSSNDSYVYSIPCWNGTSNYGCTVRDCPWSNSMTIGSIGIESVEVLWKVNSYYYIQYNVSGGTKMGYVPVSCINTSSEVPNEVYYPRQQWGKTQTVYDCPDSSSMTVGTIDASDNYTVLYDYSSDTFFMYVEYPAPSAPGGYKRGWVHEDEVG